MLIICYVLRIVSYDPLDYPIKWRLLRLFFLFLDEEMRSYRMSALTEEIQESLLCLSPSYETQQEGSNLQARKRVFLRHRIS